MDASCLESCLTADEYHRFDTQGYLLVEGALAAGELARVTRAVDALYARHRAKDNTSAFAGGPPGLFSQTDFIREDQAFLDLVDWPRVFPKIWGILGWNIYLYHAHCDVTPPVPVAEGAEDSRQRSYRAWHQDSMRVNDEIEVHPRPRLSIKVAYFLTDTTLPGCGNMWVYPGSHRQDDLQIPPGDVDPPGAVPVEGPPGTAIIFDRRLWHSRSLNTSPVTRKGVFFGYAYRWLQAKDDMNVRQLYPQLDPIRRQILGDATCADGRYAPQDGDVPLRGWLQAQQRLESAGLGLHGREGRQRQLDGFVDLVRDMARLGVGILCWNFMPDDDWTRTTATALDRGGALVTAFDAADLEPTPGRGGPITADRLWDNLAWFLDRIVPVAEREGVKLALHPDDPPMSPLRRQDRILVSPEAFERVFAINDSPANGMCFCQGTFASMGDHDIPALIRRFGPRIHYVHFRDVVGAVPRFRETFHDNGKTDMAAAIRAYRAIGFTGPARPDHVPTLEGESNELAGYHMQGRLFAVGYMRGLLDATA